jgi:hypothetical protein
MIATAISRCFVHGLAIISPVLVLCVFMDIFLINRILLGCKLKVGALIGYHSINGYN